MDDIRISSQRIIEIIATDCGVSMYETMISQLQFLNEKYLPSGKKRGFELLGKKAADPRTRIDDCTKAMKSFYEGTVNGSFPEK